MSEKSRGTEKPSASAEGGGKVQGSGGDASAVPSAAAMAELQSMMINFKDFPSQASSFPPRAGTTRETKHHG